MKSYDQWLEAKRNMNDRIVVIMRGTPGSGKSYTARELLKKYGGGDPAAHIFSTDDYFIQDVLKERRDKETAGEFVDAQYYDELEHDTYRHNWAAEKLGSAHGWNFRRFCKSVDMWMTPLVVDNTNTTAREIRGYVEYAHKAGYKIVIAEPSSPWWNDHKHMLDDKEKHGKQIEDFARFLAGFHQGMEKKYGARGNIHGVPLDVIRNMLRRWQPKRAIKEFLKEEFPDLKVDFV